MPLAGGALAVAGPAARAFHVMQTESGFGAWRAAFQESRQQSTERALPHPSSLTDGSVTNCSWAQRRGKARGRVGQGSPLHMEKSKYSIRIMYMS
eukprot:scaffold7391_cov198-Prasinococcus_capsulatus_cf.AAC.4